jgi:hypothetical protein
MDKPYDTQTYKGFTINVIVDDNPSDPTDWDLLGDYYFKKIQFGLQKSKTFETFNQLMEELALEVDPTLQIKMDYWGCMGKGYSKLRKKYSIQEWGTKVPAESEEKIHQLITDSFNKNYVYLPIYKYDHSGIKLQTTPFTCKWDSGQIGFVIVSKEKIKKEYNKRVINKKLIEEVIEILESEVDIISDYVSGNIFGYTIIDPLKSDTIIDSCWGFYGTDWKNNGLLEVARDQIDDAVREEEEVDIFVNNHFAL